jgi:transglutaminase-like putative cysteine protease
LVALVLFARRASAAPPGFVVEPLPAWVQRAEPDASPAPPEMVSNGCELALVDDQVRIGASSVDAYTHMARRIIASAGLDAASKVSIEFDATYQSLAFHFVRVRRGDAVIDRFDASAVKLAQREPNLDRQMYDGRRSALLFISDLRVGDVVEYAYTLHGADPTLGGRYADELLLGGTEPIARRLLRVLAPRDHALSFRGHMPGGASVDPPDPEMHALPYGTEYVWDRARVPAYPVESDLPAWFVPVPWVELSEFASWNDVAAWGAKLFRVPRLSGKAASAVAGWRREAESPEAFLLRAVRFVQDEVRYVGIEVGMGRRRPADPNVVFERRYGDCKDKSALLVAILEAGGVEAHAALASLGASRNLGEREPSPNAFDHAIVRVGGPDERPYWVDATASRQGGGLEALRHSDLGWALVLVEHGAGLQVLPEVPIAPSPSIRERFVLPEAGGDGEARLEVERTYSGPGADSMRAALEDQSQEQRTQSYLEIYGRRFPAVREVAPLEWQDDRPRNVVVVHAHYAIPKIWAWNEASARYELRTGAGLLDATLSEPGSIARTQPLAFPHPVRLHQVTTLELPLDLALDPADVSVKSPAFRFDFTSRYADRAVTYTYDLTSTDDAVWPRAVEQHAGAIRKARGELERVLWIGKTIEEGPSWPAVLVLLSSLPLVGWAMWRGYRLDPPWRPRADVVGRRGIGGLLLFVAFRVVVTPLVVLTAYSSSSWVFSHRSWSALATSGDANHRALAYLCLVEVAVNAAMVGYSILCAVVFFQKKRSFPFHFTAFTAMNVVFLLLDSAAAQAVELGPEQAGDVGRTMGQVITAAGFVAYLWSSKRVAATFVERPVRRKKRRKRRSVEPTVAPEP